MHLSHITRSALLVTALLGTFAVSETTAQAATNYDEQAKQTKLKTYPKKLRGTWYHYYGKKIGLHKIVITKHQFKARIPHHKLAKLNVFCTKDQYKGRQASYTFFKKGNSFDYNSLYTSTITVKGKKHTVLCSLRQADAAPWAYTHFNPGKHQYMGRYATLKNLYPVGWY